MPGNPFTLEPRELRAEGEGSLGKWVTLKYKDESGRQVEWKRAVKTMTPPQFPSSDLFDYLQQALRADGWQYESEVAGTVLVMTAPYSVGSADQVQRTVNKHLDNIIQKYGL